jgi:hypothetical protein
MLRYLRVAFSITCLIACVLLIVLWVRSYWQYQMLLVRLNTSSDLQILSYRGKVATIISPPKITIATRSFRMAPRAGYTSNDAWEWSHGSVESGLGGELQDNFEADRRNPFESRESERTTIITPDWFLVLISAVVAIPPWLRLRFSLRTLLIATALVAAVLGSTVWALR